MPRQEVITKTFLKFEELNEEQAEKAIQDNRDFNVDHGWWRHNIDDSKEIGKLLGFEIDNIYFSGLSSQGDGACFECSFSHEKDIIKNIIDYAPQDETLHQIAKDVQDLYRKSFYTAYGKTKQTGYYTHEYSMNIDIECEKGQADHDEWRDVIADFARWIYGRLNDEYDYLTSDDVIAESLIVNEVEFEV